MIIRNDASDHFFFAYLAGRPMTEDRFAYPMKDSEQSIKPILSLRKS
jgi:hypothetical protein